MPAKKLTSRFHTFLLLYYFLGEEGVVLSNSTKRLLTHLCILLSPCAAHSAQGPQSAHTAQPQPEQQRRRQQSPAALLYKGLQHSGQLPAQAEGKRRQPAGAEGAPIRRAGQVERPGQRRVLLVRAGPLYGEQLQLAPGGPHGDGLAAAGAEGALSLIHI